MTAKICNREIVNWRSNDSDNSAFSQAQTSEKHYNPSGTVNMSDITRVSHVHRISSLSFVRYATRYHWFIIWDPHQNFEMELPKFYISNFSFHCIFIQLLAITQTFKIWESPALICYAWRNLCSMISSRTCSARQVSRIWAVTCPLHVKLPFKMRIYMLPEWLLFPFKMREYHSGCMGSRADCNNYRSYSALSLLFS